MNEHIVTIPLCQLVRSKANMRRTEKNADIAQLADNIAAVGLLENLVVQPAPAIDGVAPSYEVVAGGRRLAALQKLANSGKIASSYSVPCRIVEGVSVETLTEISLAENFQRVPAHPADQFEAFARLSKGGASAAIIASRFGVTKTFVEQRLKLASVSPKILAAYRRNEMSLEQLTAFTINEDQSVQEQVWSEMADASPSPRMLRRMLTKSSVEASDRRARFIGVKAYQKAGGTIVRDLFDAENEGYFADSQLLDRLVAEKLKGMANALGAQGWSWVEVQTEPDMLSLRKFRRLTPSEVALPEADEKKLSALGERYDALVAELEESEDADSSQELDRIEAEINALQARKAVWTGDDKARSGVVIGLGHDGTLSRTFGLVRSEDDDEREEQTGSSRPAKEGYPESVQLDLSAHRTAALRASVTADPDLAYRLLLGCLVRQVFGDGAPDCMEIRITETSLERASQTVGESKAAGALSKQHAYWSQKYDVAGDKDAWLARLTKSQQHKLMAYCVAVSINALRMSGHERHGVDELVTLTGLDMAQWWKADAVFFARLSKADIHNALLEMAPATPRSRYDQLGKADLAKFAEKTAIGWMPPVFRKHQAQLAEAAE